MRRSRAASVAVLLTVLLAADLPTARPGSAGSEPRCGEIAYVVHDGDRSALASIRPSGRARRRLTPFSASGWHRPTWSPDGTKLAALKDSSSGSDLWVMRADMSRRRRLTNAPGFDEGPVWLPDSSGLVFERFGAGAAPGIWFVALDGRERRIVDDGYHPDVSPDGARVAFALGGSAGDIATVALDGSDRRILTHDPGSGDSHPRWSPAADELTFQRIVLGGPSPDAEDVDPIWRIDGDGGGALQLTHSEDQVDRVSDARWSPDGARIAYVATTDGRHTVRTMGRDGSGDVGISGGTWYSSDDPTWGPGSDRIAYELETRGYPSIWVAAIDESAKNRIAGTRRRPATEPDWAACR